MGEKNFAEVFCERHGVPRERFVDALLGRALYPHARLLLPSINFWSGGNVLRADREILDDIGRASDLTDISSILSRMQWYYGQGWLFRHRLRLRISSRRVLDIARPTLARLA